MMYYIVLAFFLKVIHMITQTLYHCTRFKKSITSHIWEPTPSDAIESKTIESEYTILELNH